MGPGRPHAHTRCACGVENLDAIAARVWPQRVPREKKTSMKYAFKKGPQWGYVENVSESLTFSSISIRENFVSQHTPTETHFHAHIL